MNNINKKVLDTFNKSVINYLLDNNFVENNGYYTYKNMSFRIDNDKTSILLCIVK